MMPFNFVKNIMFALLLAVLGSGAYAATSIILTDPAAIKATVALLAAIYGGALLYSAADHTGRLVLPFVWLLITTFSIVLMNTHAFLIEQIGLMWLVRSLYYHGGPLAALADLGITGCAYGAAIWAAGTGSWFMVTWSFFLVLSLTGLIPNWRQPNACITPNPDSNPDSYPEEFHRARAQANAALKKLITN